jgi:hypothetical protein
LVSPTRMPHTLPTQNNVSETIKVLQQPGHNAEWIERGIM